MDLEELKRFVFKRYFDMVCFLDYISYYNNFKIRDLEGILSIIRKNKTFFKQHLVLRKFKLFLERSFILKGWFKTSHFRNLREILVQRNYFQDKELYLYFKFIFEKWFLKLKFKNLSDFSYFLKTNYDFFDCLYFMRMYLT